MHRLLQNCRDRAAHLLPGRPRVHALVVPIAPEVSAPVIDVFVSNNEIVTARQELFSLDPNNYRLAVETAEADLQSARQATGASTANVAISPPG